MNLSFPLNFKPRWRAGLWSQALAVCCTGKARCLPVRQAHAWGLVPDGSGRRAVEAVSRSLKALPRNHWDSVVWGGAAGGPEKK